MRLEIILSPEELRFAIPVNYNYLIYNAFIGIFQHGPQKSVFEPMLLESVCRHNLWSDKLFTFSRLFNDSSKISEASFSGFGNISFYFSAPIAEELVPDFIRNLKMSKHITINGFTNSDKYFIHSIKQLPEPEFSDSEKFIMLSPTTISKYSHERNYRKIHFHRINEEETVGTIAYNLRQKYQLVNGFHYDGPLDIKFDMNYVKGKGGAEAVSKLITIRQGSNDEYKIKGFVAPVRIKSDPEMIKIAYHCGIGEKNHYGLGMIEKVVPKPNFAQKAITSNDLLNSATNNYEHSAKPLIIKRPTMGLRHKI